MSDSELKELEIRLEAQGKQLNEIMEQCKANTNAVGDLTVQTADVVKLSNEVKGAIKTGARFQQFIMWLSKFGVAGAAIATVVQWVTKNLSG